MQQSLFESLPATFASPDRARLLSPSAQSWLAQWLRHRAADRRARANRARLLESLLPLIKRTARGFWDRGSLEVADLVQVGALAAMQGMEQYKPCTGKTLAGYLKDLHIVPAMRRAIRAQKTDVRLTEDGQRYHWQIRRLEREGLTDDEEIAARIKIRGSGTVGVPVEKVVEIRSAARLEHTVLDEAKSEPDDSPNAEEHLAKKETATVVRKRVRKLDSAHRRIISALFMGDEPPPLSEVAKRYGLTQAEVERLRDEALQQMRDIEDELDGEF